MTTIDIPSTRGDRVRVRGLLGLVVGARERTYTLILTMVPTVNTGIATTNTSAGTARAVARALGLPLVAPEVGDLTTFDESHLDAESAQRWSDALFGAAAPQLRTCLEDGEPAFATGNRPPVGTRRPMTHWLPAPRDFRGDLRAALNTPPHSTDRLERLAALARHRLDFLETIQLDRALSQLTADATSKPRIRVAVLASSTVDHLVPAVRVAGLRHGLFIDVHVAGYGQYRQELLNTDSDLSRFNPQFVLLSLTAREAVSRTSALASEAEVDATIDGLVHELRVLWQRARGTLNATIVSMVLFRSQTLAAATTLLQGLIGMNGVGLTSGSGFALANTAGWILLLGVIAVACPNTLQLLARYEPALGWKPDRREVFVGGRIPGWNASPAWATVVAVVAAMAILRTGGPSEFLYWQF